MTPGSHWPRPKEEEILAHVYDMLYYTAYVMKRSVIL